MKLSIITINRNNAEGLQRTLVSVASQTYREIEHIIVDGASTDDSVAVIREYAEDQTLDIKHHTSHSVSWVSEPDKGIYNAINKGIKRATGEYIQILNSGDILAAPDVTERMVSALDSLNAKRSSLNEDAVGILYGNMIKEYPGGKRIKDISRGGLCSPESFLYFYNGTLNHDCAYIRRDLFDKYGLYDENMRICSDWAWYMKAIALGGEKSVYTNIDVTIFDMNGISESGGKNAELIKKERRAYLESVLPASILHDYDTFVFPILQYQRLRKYHLWPLVYFLERVLFKLEKWHILR